MFVNARAVLPTRFWQVVMLFALQQGYADAVPPEDTAAWMARAVQWVRQVAPRALREVAAARQLTAAAEKGIGNALQALNSARAGSG
jgi:F0F1-type ATP synthase alpha subunit